MDITLKNQQGLDATLHIQIEPADYQAEFDKKIDEYRKKSTFPGFRTGKAPLGLVKKMIGADVRHDVIEHMLQHKIQDYLKENNIKPLLNPIANYKHGDIDWAKENFEFSYDLGIRPEVNIDYNALSKIPMHDVEIEDADLEKELTLARRQHGKADTAETFTDEPGVMAYVRFTEVGDDGQVLEGGVTQTKLLGNTEMPAKLKDILSGKEKDFKQEADIHDLMTDEEIMEHLEVDDKVAKDLDKMEIELTNVFKLEDAPLDQEFFDRYFEPGTISDEAAFREGFRKLMAGYLNREAESQWMTKMKDHLVENTEVEYPEGLLKKK